MTKLINFAYLFVFYFLIFAPKCYTNDILGCGGFVKSHASLDFSKIEIGLYTKEGSLKEKTECAPTNGYYFLPLYEKGEYILKIHPPAGWSFEPSEVELNIDGETDQCSTGHDINFAFNGFGITGRVITAGQKQGPSGINVQLINENGDVRNTVTTVGGDFHFTPVIPGKYVVKASHSKWKLDPAQTVVQVKEGNTALPAGSLTVKGYDVSGSITSFGSPISGIYVLLYSKEEKQKFKVEGCKTALLQGVPDAPICYSVTDSGGEFHFGLVPAGEYNLLALSKSPGQAHISYNIKPNGVPFSVQHDSLYIKNAFEINGFTVIGSVLSSPAGDGMSGVRVLLNGEPVATSDASGKFTLTGLKPATYVLNFEHDKSQFEEVQVTVTSAGVAGAVRAAAARWRVCGALAPPEPRALAVLPGDLAVLAGHDGKWCTFLAPGTYTVKVEVSEQEQREGLQYFPASRSVAVGAGGADGVSFSQVRAQLRGRVTCAAPAPCAGLRVALRPLAADGHYAGPPRYADVKDGEYVFEEVPPGSVEVAVVGGEARLCWAQAAHNVAVAEPRHRAPPIALHGLALHVSSTHDIEVEYKSGNISGVLSVPAGRSRQCVPLAPRYELAPRGCHRVEPRAAAVRMDADDVPSVEFVATAHSNGIVIHSPEPATDVVLKISADGQEEQLVPLQPTPRDDGYVYEHTLYLAEGEVAVVTAQSNALLFTPRGAQRVAGGATCAARALALAAARALTLSGRIDPPVAGVEVVLEGGDVKLTQITKEDGEYRFGPLAADAQYAVSARKESYAFGARDAAGRIPAQRLAQIHVLLLDAGTGEPLDGALVSVSGGAFRRNVAAGGGRARFAALQPAHYYVKPNMKEFRFEPPHALRAVAEGGDYTETFKGVRVAWSVFGRVVSLSGAGAARVALRARPAPSASAPPAACPQQDATADQNGDFRIRGLLPNCVYQIELKESSEPELAGMELAKAPPLIEMKEEDVRGLRLVAVQGARATDGGVVVRAPPEHAAALRVRLAGVLTARLPRPSSAAAGALLPLPRLPADNATYALHVECTLSKLTHTFEEPVFYFNSDGKFKSFDVDFVIKVKSSEQELRQSSVLVLPALGALALLYWQRRRLPALPALPRPDLVRRPRGKKAQ
ncbi:unnamed protein product, partial [Brenthis ino]